MSVEEQAYRYAVKNAFQHAGKADVGAVVGKLKALNPETEMKALAMAAKKAVETANALPKNELEADYKKFEAEGYELKPKEKEEGLADLSWAENGKVSTRFAPNPNGPIHLGSSRAAVLSHEYARKYNGRFILRFDDTDPKVKKPIDNAEEIFREDLGWLGCKIDQLFFASDRLPIYESYMEKLLKMGHAYACTCPVEEWRALVRKEKACQCRDLSPEKQMERFNQMRSHKLKEGEVVLRIKTSLSHKDPSIRDWWIAKIVDKPVHPRVSETQHLWPSYNFASAIDDHELGTTLIIRGQEHAQNETKQMFLYNYFGWEYPHALYTGRVMLEGAVLSTSKIKEGIAKGEYIGWSDPRLGTIAALRRRGFHPEAIRRVIISIGTKPNDTTITWDQLAAENRELIKAEAEKIKALEDPFKLIVESAPAKKIHSEFGDVTLNEGLQGFFVEKSAVEKSAGTIIRLREAYNVKIKKVSELQAIGEYAGEEKMEPIVPWISEGVEIQVILPTAKKITKIADTRIMSKNVGERVYLDRIGYCIIDKKEEGKATVWLTHR
jgi:glutamyl-tRNA synthetase